MLNWGRRGILVGVYLAWLLGPAPLPAQTSNRIVILISLDGFRWDYLTKFQPTNLRHLAANGVQAQRLVSAFPSLTFPNHYTLVTGLWPEHHGIIGNNFYDPETKQNFTMANSGGPAARHWWGGEPIWGTAIKQGRRANCMFWPGSSVPIGGVLPTEWRAFDKQVKADECVDTVLGWLAAPSATRPDFVTMYFHQTDTAAHHDGVDSPQVAQAVAEVDAALGRLTAGVARLQLSNVVNLVIVSDHGMADLSPQRVVPLGDLIELNRVQVDFSGALAGLRPRDGDEDRVFATLKSQARHFAVYRRENMPARFHFRDHPRIPPIILLADEGWFLAPRTAAEQAGRELLKATHGFDPKLKSMGGIFIASGPAFRSGIKLGALDNVHVYDLLCATLGLQPAPNDGDPRLARKVLVK